MAEAGAVVVVAAVVVLNVAAVAAVVAAVAVASSRSLTRRCSHLVFRGVGPVFLKLLGARASLLVTKGIATRSKDATSNY